MRYGSVAALDTVDLRVAGGEFVTLLGPSGCGKTTLLRTIAGLVEPQSGEIVIRGRAVTEVPIHRRNIGLVFQSYALFPHKTVFENIAFGLKYRRLDRSTIAERVGRALSAIRLPDVGGRMPAQLSGGQQQRVALARALVIEPDILLLDEPLSALDANLREEMRIELKQIQRRFGIASVFVTHDQEEALALSDKIVVMNQGRIEQVGAPQDVYHRPASGFVARFVGQSNVLEARVIEARGSTVLVEAQGVQLLATPVRDLPVGAAARIVVKAPEISLAPEGTKLDGTLNLLPGTVEAISYLGASSLYVVAVGSARLKALVPGLGTMAEGAPVTLTVPISSCLALPDD